MLVSTHYRGANSRSGWYHIRVKHAKLLAWLVCAQQGPHFEIQWYAELMFLVRPCGPRDRLPLVDDAFGCALVIHTRPLAMLELVSGRLCISCCLTRQMPSDLRGETLIWKAGDIVW